MGEIVILKDRRPKNPENREVMCEIVCYGNGDVTVWLANYIETPEQFNWLFAKLAGATGSLFEEKLSRTEHK